MLHHGFVCVFLVVVVTMFDNLNLWPLQGVYATPSCWGDDNATVPHVKAVIKGFANSSDALRLGWFCVNEAIKNDSEEKLAVFAQSQSAAGMMGPLSPSPTLPRKSSKP